MTSELFSARENTGVSETIEYMCAKRKRVAGITGFMSWQANRSGC